MDEVGSQVPGRLFEVFKGTGRITFFRTKNNRRRTMRLMPRTRDALLYWRERLLAERKSAGLEDFHFHDLRHAFCSSVIMAGGDIKMACDMIGHSDIKMTSRYAHLTQLAHDNMQAKLAGYYASPQQEKTG